MEGLSTTFIISPDTIRNNALYVNSEEITDDKLEELIRAEERNAETITRRDAWISTDRDYTTVREAIIDICTARMVLILGDPQKLGENQQKNAMQRLLDIAKKGEDVGTKRITFVG